MSQNIEIPCIVPLPEGTHRPFWSVMITSYRRTEYLERCLNSILSQDLGESEIQIEVVDDCSPNRDEIAALVAAVGRGRVAFYSQPQNVGIYENWNTCILRAQGHWVHILSDDDLVMPEFYSVYRHSTESLNCAVVLGQAIFIDENEQWTGISNPLQTTDGLLQNALWILSKDNPVRTPGIVVARRAYEQIGGFTTDLAFTPDWEMWTRLAAHFAIAYVNRPYCLFRVHSQSQTSKLILSAESVKDCLMASAIIQSRFQEVEQQRAVKLSINRWISNNSCFVSRDLVLRGYVKPALLHAAWSVWLSPSLSSIKTGLLVGLCSAGLVLKRLFSGGNLEKA